MEPGWRWPAGHRKHVRHCLDAIGRLHAAKSRYYTVADTGWNSAVSICYRRRLAMNEPDPVTHRVWVAASECGVNANQHIAFLAGMTDERWRFIGAQEIAIDLDDALHVAHEVVRRGEGQGIHVDARVDRVAVA